MLRKLLLAAALALFPLGAFAADNYIVQDATGAFKVLDCTDTAGVCRYNVNGTFTPSGTGDVNLKQVNGGTTTAFGSGVTGTQTQRVVLATDVALPAGTNVIGHVIADTGSTTAVTGNVTVVQPTGTNLHVVLDTTSTTAVTQATGTNLHTVLDSGTLTTLTTLTGTTTLTPGTGATNLGKAEDAVAGSGDTGVASLYVANEAQSTLAADGDYVIPATDTKGNSFVKGITTAADDAALTLMVKTFSLMAGYDGTTADMIRSGDVNNIASAAGYLDIFGVCRYNATLPTITDTRYNGCQIGSRGSLNVSLVDANGTTGALVGAPGDGGGSNNTLLVTSQATIFNNASWDRARSVINATNSIGTGIQAVGTLAQCDDTSPTAASENQFGNLRRVCATGELLVAPTSRPNGAVPETATSGIVSNAAAAATLATSATTTTYIEGFECTAGAATGAAMVKIIVSGTITGSMTYYTAVTNATTFVPAPIPMVVEYASPIPASAANTTIVVTMDAVGTGGATAVCNAHGFKL